MDYLVLPGYNYAPWLSLITFYGNVTDCFTSCTILEIGNSLEKQFSQAFKTSFKHQKYSSKN